MQNSRATLFLPFLALLACSPSYADEQSQANAKELEAVIKAELKTRAPKRLLKLVAEKRRPKKGKRARGYQYNPRVLKRLWGSTSKSFQDAFPLKGWTAEVSVRHKWLGYPLAADKAEIKKVVIHREFASVFWDAEFSEVTKGFKKDSHAHLRLKKTVPLPRKKGSPSSVWTKSGKDWLVAVRPTPAGKWEEHNPRGEPLRATPKGFDANGPSAAEVCRGLDANEDKVFEAKNDRKVATQALAELKASFSGKVIWDVGVIEEIRLVGRGMQKGSSVRVRVGHAIFEVSDSSIGASDHYAKLSVGSLVAFRGTFDRAKRSPDRTKALEVTRAPYQIYLTWPRSKDPATFALEN
jgi:hypothetical protein